MVDDLTAGFELNETEINYENHIITFANTLKEHNYYDDLHRCADLDKALANLRHSEHPNAINKMENAINTHIKCPYAHATVWDLFYTRAPVGAMYAPIMLPAFQKAIIQIGKVPDEGWPEKDPKLTPLNYRPPSGLDWKAYFFSRAYDAAVKMSEPDDIDTIDEDPDENPAKNKKRESRRKVILSNLKGLKDLLPELRKKVEGSLIDALKHAPDDGEKEYIIQRSIEDSIYEDEAFRQYLLSKYGQF